MPLKKGRAVTTTDREVYDYLHKLMLNHSIDGWCNAAPGNWELFVAPGSFDAAHSLAPDERQQSSTELTIARLRSLGHCELSPPSTVKAKRAGKAELVALLRKLIPNITDESLLDEATRLLEAA